GLKVIDLHTTDPPVTIITPADASPTSRPTILIAHGFAGSSVLMRGFALTLAHAGYTTVSWDFPGHARNPNSLNFSSESSQLLQDAERALSAAQATGMIDSQHVAILGHSMGSGVALSYGIQHPDTSATIAISPTGQPVTPSLPHNLLLMAGSLEPQFVSNAERLFSMAGGRNDDFASSTARQLDIVPNVEHITILFSPAAHATARLWLDETFRPQPGATSYTDRRILWFCLGILGFIFLTNAGLQLISRSSRSALPDKPFWLRIIALLAGGISATLLLWLLGLLGINLTQILGLLVGGYLLIWFGIAGVVSLVILRPHISRPTVNQLIKTLMAFAGLWLGVGLLGNFVWLPWLLIPSRLLLWVPGSVIILPWFIVVGEVTVGASLSRQIGWWLFQSASIILSLILAIMLTPQLGFIMIILPLVPVMIGIHMLVISSRHGSWAYAFSGAMFIAWLLPAVFPLQ
ncbi:MAG TPA: alpha/beta fold hydrolase, partial [Anaerolineales bacterium]